jgi:hypothetical protein
MDDVFCMNLATIISAARATLTTLNAAGNAISHNCITALARSFSIDGGMPRLKTINLADNGLTDADLFPLWVALSFPTYLPALDVLGLSSNPLSDISIDNSMRAYNRSEVGMLLIDLKNDCVGFGQSTYSNASVCDKDTTAGTCFSTADEDTACCYEDGSYVAGSGCSGDSNFCTVDLLAASSAAELVGDCVGPAYVVFNPYATLETDFLCLTISFTQSSCTPPA